MEKKAYSLRIPALNLAEKSLSSCGCSYYKVLFLSLCENQGLITGLSKEISFVNMSQQ